MLLLLVLPLVVGGTFAYIQLTGDEPTTATTTSDDPTADSGKSTPPAGKTTVTPSPAAEPTTPPPAPAEDAAPKAPPLAIAAEYLNQACTDEYIVMLATEDDPSEYEAHLGSAVATVRNARYLSGIDSCEAFVKRGPQTQEYVYNAYIGPFPTLSEACQALAGLDSETAWTRQLTYPSPDRSLCICETPPTALPVIGGSDGVETSPPALPTRRAIAQVQWILYQLGLNDRESIYGNYNAAFDAQIRIFQVQQGLIDRAVDGGRIGETTWTALRTEYCDNSAYFEFR